MDIHPIRTEEDYELAVRAIENLWSAVPGSPDADRLDVLATLVAVYQDKNHSIAPPDPVSAILFRMEQMNLTRKDLEKYIGSRSRVAEILNRTRSLSLTMIRNLYRGLNIPIEVLIQEQPRAIKRKSKTNKHNKAPRKAA